MFRRIHFVFALNSEHGMEARKYRNPVVSHDMEWGITRFPVSQATPLIIG